jgi:hypothetical protein
MLEKNNNQFCNPYAVESKVNVFLMLAVRSAKHYVLLPTTTAIF